MKHLKKYNESNYDSNLIRMGEEIQDILLDISDDGYHVNYNFFTNKTTQRFDIIISTFNVYEVGILGRTNPDMLEWSKISDTIHRIEDYLNEYTQSYRYDWEIYVVNGRYTNVYNYIKEVDEINPSSREYQVNIEIYKN